ncbi:iron uptake system component EfeO [Chromohalobacter marismortui]|uniref:Iron uptake system component EfeO n=1 Tax=Chromohalobacter marismortui TaxID=42055 RepID=A0A4R7NNP7_9GAMM|nr:MULTISPECIES: iron uptake system protein EfeO [Chromohalobacter]MCI0509470.1 iron uptake system protein EfeO [Chromohalobacter sp.]MCI0592636.1 iron uptake system protein EfeO [Chromohalobacter sp.]TDU22189.1 iron uptake system component EfeO [Chromohalobacter marismortui]
MSRRSLLFAASAFGLMTLQTPAQADVAPDALVEPVAEYKLYVLDNLDQFVSHTEKFTQAVEHGHLQRAQALYAPTRVYYERIEPIAELFADLDASIDAREDDYENGVEDPDFTGFHRLEYGLFKERTTQGFTSYAKRLMTDVNDLESRVQGLTFPPAKVVGGAAALMEEVAATKVSGEEDRYSHTDLWDFQGNVDGSQKIFELFKPLVAEEDPAFVQRVEKNFAAVEATLAHYRREADNPEAGFVSYEKVSQADRRAFVGPVTVLAEDLSTLRGKLGL